MRVIREIEDLDGLYNDKNLEIHILNNSIDICSDGVLVFGLTVCESLNLKKTVEILNKIGFDICYTVDKEFCLTKFLDENFYCDYNGDNEIVEYLAYHEREENKWELMEDLYVRIPYVVYLEVKADKDIDDVMELLNKQKANVSDMKYAFEELGWK